MPLRKDHYHDIDLKANQLFNSRLHNISTADRNTLGSTLGLGDYGYQVYDVDILVPYWWDGTQWISWSTGGGTVTSVSATAGTGISVSVTNPTTTPNITIVNTAPDQIVTIAAGTGISVTGTYPNFTVTNTGLLGITANNGLTANTTSNVQLGGTLIQTTSILTNANSFTIERQANGNTINIVNSSSGAGNSKTALFASSTDGNAGEFEAGNTLIANNGIQGILKVTRTTANPASPNYNEIGGAIDFLNPTVTGMLSPAISYTNRIASRWENSVSDPIGGSYALSRFELWGYDKGQKRNLAVVGTGSLILDQYGSGNFTGTPTYNLQVDSTGNVIEGSLVTNGLVTADNGLTANTSSNVQLGGTLLQNTTVDTTSAYYMRFTGARVGKTKQVLEAINTGNGFAFLAESNSAANGGAIRVNTNGIGLYVESSDTGITVQQSAGVSTFNTINNLSGVKEVLSIGKITSSTLPSNGDGARLSFNLNDKTSANAAYATGYISSVYSDVATLKSKMEFGVANASSLVGTAMTLFGDGQLQVSKYGVGSFTGTPAYALQVDASGNIIEGTVTSGTLTGSGTINYVPKWSSSTALTDSSIFDNGTSVGVGTNTPNATHKLQVVGNVATTTGINIDAVVATKTGIYGSTNTLDFWAGNNKMGTYTLVGNIAGASYFHHNIGFNNSGGASGTQNALRITGSVADTGVNSMIHNQLLIDPQYVHGSFGTGAVRGVYYNPTVTSLNGASHIAWENTSGDIIHGNLSGVGTRMVTADSTGTLGVAAIPTGTVTGTGTTNYVPKWDGTGTNLVDSQIFDDGTYVKVGNGGGSIGFPYETLILEANQDMKFGTYTSTPAFGTQAAAYVLGYTGVTTTSGFYPGFEFQHFGDLNDVNNLIRYNYILRNPTGTVVAAVQNLLNIYPTGKVTINPIDISTGITLFPQLLVGLSSSSYSLDVEGATQSRIASLGGGGVQMVTADNNGVLSVQAIPTGGSSRSVNVVSTNTAAGSASGTDYVYLVSGTTTITLPTAVGNTNLYTIKRVGTGVISIATTSSETIDGSASPININVQYVSLDLISDGTNWNII